MNKFVKAIALPLALAGLITGCGWQLRGQMTIADGINNIYVSAKNAHGQLANELKNTIKNNQITVGTTQSDAQYSIFIEREDEDRRTVAVGGDTLASEYELNMSADYRIENQAGAIVVPTTTAEAIRNYSYDRNDVIAKDEEERLIKEEMRRTIVQQILRRLSFASRASAEAATAADAVPVTPDETTTETTGDVVQ